MCPMKHHEMCPSAPKNPGKCVKTKCDKSCKPGYGKVTVRNCFGSNLDKVLASYTDTRGKQVCDKERWVEAPKDATLHLALLLL